MSALDARLAARRYLKPDPEDEPEPSTGEVRVTNDKTGGQKGAKPERMSLLPLDVLMKHVAPHYAKGAEKYAPDNWRKGYDWSLSADALLRHFAAFWSEGEDNDPEFGTRHLAAVVFHALTLLYFMDEHPDLDDRSDLVKGGEQE